MKFLIERCIEMSIRAGKSGILRETNFKFSSEQEAALFYDVITTIGFRAGIIRSNIICVQVKP